MPEKLQEQPKIIVPSEQKQLKIVENGKVTKIHKKLNSNFKREKLPNEKQTDGTSAASIPKANESVQTEEVIVVNLEELEEESASRPRFQSLLKVSEIQKINNFIIDRILVRIKHQFHKKAAKNRQQMSNSKH